MHAAFWLLTPPLPPYNSEIYVYGLTLPFPHAACVLNQYPNITRQKGLQNNSGPMLSKLAYVYLLCLRLSARSDKIAAAELTYTPPPATVVSCQQRRTAAKRK